MLVTYSIARMGNSTLVVTGEIMGERKGLIQLVGKAALVGGNKAKLADIKFWTEENDQPSVQKMNSNTWLITGEFSTLFIKYYVKIAEFQGASSLYDGFIDKDLMFFLGQSVFLKVDAPDVSYKLLFEQDTIGTCSQQNDDLYCNNNYELMLSYFVQGSSEKINMPCMSKTVSIISAGMPSENIDTVRLVLPQLIATTQKLFGQNVFDSLLCFIYGKSVEKLGHGIGTGISVPGGIAIIPAAKGKTITKQLCWLIQHELTHQWLGISCKAGEVGLDWFFEGFNCYLTLLVLRECEILSIADIKAIATENIENYQQAAIAIIQNGSTQHWTEYKYGLHGGFVLALLWDSELGQQYSMRLPEWLRLVFTDLVDKVINQDILLNYFSNMSEVQLLPAYFVKYLSRTEVLPLKEFDEFNIFG